MSGRQRKTWDNPGEPTWLEDRDAGDRCFLMPRELVLKYPHYFPEQYEAITRAKDRAEGTGSAPTQEPFPKAE